jgi:hypothetical protein
LHSIKNLPSEITLNNGIKQADGSYLLNQNDLSNLQLIIGSFYATSKVLFESITALSIISDELTAASSRLATARLSLASVSS